MFIEQGVLYVVATPIGNLQDFSPRGQMVLQKVSLIAAEDTRHSRQLLNHFGITTPLYALHEHNEKQASETILQRLMAGENIALISDAGTPLISDPGQRLLAQVHEHNLQTMAVPGANAAITALSVAGLPADRFVFEGFLPAKPSARLQRLEALVNETRTLVFYEAPHRIIACLQSMINVFGKQREGVLVKELTKMFETVKRGELESLSAWLQAEPNRQKGEFVIVIAGAMPQDSQVVDEETKRIFQLLHNHLSLKQAAKLTSDITGVSKNILYQLGINTTNMTNTPED